MFIKPELSREMVVKSSNQHQSIWISEAIIEWGWGGAPTTAAIYQYLVHDCCDLEPGLLVCFGVSSRTALGLGWPMQLSYI